MKKVILLLAFAGACAAQTSPTIVKTVSLVNETKLAGSKESPVSIFTTTQDGFYRMTLLIRSETQSYIIICPTYPGSSPLYNCVQSNAPGQSSSAVFAFTAKAGTTVAFYTYPESYPYTGTYNANLALELLSEVPPAN